MANYPRLRYIDLIGQRFGQLLVLRLNPVRREKQACWDCQCDCGNLTTVRGNCLRTGTTVSCGCFGKAAARVRGVVHGRRGTPEYAAWCAMKRRCLGDHPTRRKYWGARGVTITPAWIPDFSAFFAHIGPRPSAKHSLDRFPNKDGNYEPGNVRWATWYEQIHNRRKETAKRKPKRSLQHSTVPQ